MIYNHFTLWRDAPRPSASWDAGVGGKWISFCGFPKHIYAEGKQIIAGAVANIVFKINLLYDPTE